MRLRPQPATEAKDLNSLSPVSLSTSVKIGLRATTNQGSVAVVAMVLTHVWLVNSLLLLLLAPSWADAQPPRCRALCQKDPGEDACERCRLRTFMRFGKRDSSRAVALIREPLLDVQSLLLDEDPAAAAGGQASSAALGGSSSSREQLLLESRPVPAARSSRDRYGLLLRAIRDVGGRNAD